MANGQADIYEGIDPISEPLPEAPPQQGRNVVQQARAPGTGQTFAERQQRGDTPLDPSGAPAGLRARLSFQPTQKDVVAALQQEFGEQNVRLAEDGTPIVRTIDEETGQAKEVLLDERGATLRDLADIANVVPEVATALGLTALTRNPFAGGGRLAQGAQTALKGALGAAGAGATSDVLARLQTEESVQPGEIAQRRGAQVPVDLALDAVLGGAAPTLRGLNRTLVRGDFETELVKSRNRLAEKTGIGVDLSPGQSTGLDFMLRSEGILGNLPGGGKTIKKFQDEQSRQLSETMRRLFFKEPLQSENPGFQAVQRLRNITQGVEQESRQATLRALDETASNIRKTISDLSLERRAFYRPHIGNLVRQKVKAERDAWKDQVNKKYNEAFSFDVATREIFPTSDIKKTVRDIEKQFPKESPKVIEEPSKLFDEFGRPLPSKTIEGKTQRRLFIPPRVRRTLNNVQNMASTVSPEQLKSARTQIDNAIAEGEAVPGVDTGILKRLRNAFTQALDNGIEKLKKTETARFPGTAPQRSDEQRVFEAFQALQEETGSPYQPISQLADRSGVEISKLQEILQRKQGQGVELSEGELTVATPEERQAAIQQGDRTFMTARLDESFTPARERGAPEVVVRDVAPEELERFRETLSQANETYKNRVEDFQQVGIADLFKDPTDNGFVSDTEVVSRLTSGAKAVDRYERTKKFLGENSQEWKLTKRSILDDIYNNAFDGRDAIDLDAFVKSVNSLPKEIKQDLVGERALDIFNAFRKQGNLLTVRGGRARDFLPEDPKVELSEVESVLQGETTSKGAFFQAIRKQGKKEKLLRNRIIQKFVKQAPTRIDEEITDEFDPNDFADVLMSNAVSEDDAAKVMASLSDNEQLVSDVRERAVQRLLLKARQSPSVEDLLRIKRGEAQFPSADAIIKRLGDPKTAQKFRRVLGDETFQNLTDVLTVAKAFQRQQGAAKTAGGLVSGSIITNLLSLDLRGVAQVAKFKIAANLIVGNSHLRRVLDRLPDSAENRRDMLAVLVSSAPFIRSMFQEFGVEQGKVAIESIRQELGLTSQDVSGSQAIEELREAEPISEPLPTAPTTNQSTTGQTPTTTTNQPPQQPSTPQTPPR